MDSLLRTTGKMWNMGLSAIREHYKATGEYLKPKEVYAILKKERERNKYWQMVGAQTMQEITQRLNNSYERFFKKLAKRPPKFKSSMYFKSLVLKDAGYKLNSNSLFFAYKSNGKRGMKRLRYINSRDLKYFHKNNKERNIFNVRLKRDLHNRYWVIFTVKQPKQTFKTRKTRGAIGIDFGLKTYMTICDGKKFSAKENPQFLKANLQGLKRSLKHFLRKRKVQVTEIELKKNLVRCIKMLVINVQIGNGS